MATDIGGLFTTPEQYRLAQQQAQAAEASQYAQLDPRSQVQYGLYRGGQQLAQGLGNLFGVQDPQMQLIARRQQLASQLDQNDPESYNKVANLAIQSGDAQFGILLAQEGRKVEESLAGVNLKKAQAQKAKDWKQTQTDSAQKRQAISDLEEKLAKVLTFTKAIKNAYTNVGDVVVNKSQCAFTAITYMGESDRRVIHQQKFELDLNLESGKSLHAQIYDALKADAAYQKATDA